jgi:hypothetical protein
MEEHRRKSLTAEAGIGECCGKLAKGPVAGHQLWRATTQRALGEAT